MIYIEQTYDFVKVRSTPIFKDEEEIYQALQLLGDRLEFTDAPHTALVVGGGSALNALGLVKRTTRDIDVVALLDGAGFQGLSRAEPLPNYLQEEVRNVAHDLGLPEDWLNPGPAALVDFGLPQGWLERAQIHEFGSRLRVFFVGRFEQIHFKLYAAVDQGGGRHIVDLLALKPTPDELLTAAQWTRTHDVSEGFRQMLTQTLRQMGHDDVADKL